MPVTTEYKLVGLEKLHNENYMSATLLRFGDKSEETIRALIEGDKSHKDAIWNYCSGNWGNLKAITITDENNQIWVHKVEHINNQ